MNIFYTRARILNLIKRHETYIVFGAKFFSGLLLYGFVFSIGMYRDELAFLFTAPLSVPFMVLLAVGFAFFPATANYLLLSFIVTAQLSSSLEAASFAFLIMVCVIVFYVRISPQKSYLLLALMAAFYFRVPYAVVIFAGLYVGLASILPIILGTFIYFTAPGLLRIAEYMKSAEGVDMMEMPSRFMEAYTSLFENLTTYHNWIVVTFIFIMVAMGIYAVSKLSIDYVKEIAIAFGAIVCIMCFILASIVIDGFDVSILAVLFGTIGSVVIVAVIRFFDDIPQYQRTESVRFEDDQNYYHCKIVPKLAFPKELQTKAQPRKPTKHEIERQQRRREREQAEGEKTTRELREADFQRPANENKSSDTVQASREARTARTSRPTMPLRPKERNTSTVQRVDDNVTPPNQ